MSLSHFIKTIRDPIHRINKKLNTLSRDIYPKKFIDFDNFPHKEISQEKLDLFWKDYFNKKRIFKKIVSDNGIEVMAVTPTVLGVVKATNNINGVLGYLTKVLEVNKFFAKQKPKTFDLRMNQVLDVKEVAYGRYYILERVYPTITCEDILSGDLIGSALWKNLLQNSYSNRYTKPFVNKMLRRNIDFDEFRLAVTEAKDEFIKLSYNLIRSHDAKTDLYYDLAGRNLLVLDYNPETKKVLFQIIDVNNVWQWW
jgi:hypothetical protein